ncbi:MAG TPA: hypothetical protein ENN60_00540 [archaeon]|nr:hypothetical protein [archaeon]
MRKLFALFLLMSVGFALTFDAYTTAPSPLKEQGYVYLTFCSSTTEYVGFEFSAPGFQVSPREVAQSFSGTSILPDCRQVVLFVKADQPGQYNLLAKGHSNEWVVPVVFEKDLPLSISASKSVVYTGYTSLDLTFTGEGRDVWLSLDGDVVGLDSLYRSALPATFPVTFYFSETGFQQVPLTLTYSYGNASMTRTFNLGLRVVDAPITIEGPIEVPSGGMGVLSLSITSPETLYSPVVSLSSSCLEGELRKYLETFTSGVLDFEVRTTCDPGIYPLEVAVGDYVRSVPLKVTGPEGYELFFNPKITKGESRLEVVIANKGSDDMRAVSVRLLDGDYIKLKEGSFIGDLTQGDYDSTDLEFIPTKNPVQVNFVIFYNQGGERHNITRQLTYSYVKGGVSIWGLLILAGIGYVVYRKFRGRKASG